MFLKSCYMICYYCCTTNVLFPTAESRISSCHLHVHFQAHFMRLTEKICLTVFHIFSPDNISKEYPLRIRFKGELAIDTGGILHDMVSAFWEIVYEKGCNVLVGSDAVMFTKLGHILSHGYMLVGFYP